MEGLFKFIFFLAIFLFCLVIIGIFLLIIKIILLFNGEFTFFGITFLRWQ